MASATLKNKVWKEVYWSSVDQRSIPLGYPRAISAWISIFWISRPFFYLSTIMDIHFKIVKMVKMAVHTYPWIVNGYPYIYTDSESHQVLTHNVGIIHSYRGCTISVSGACSFHHAMRADESSSSPHNPFSKVTAPAVNCCRRRR